MIVEEYDIPDGYVVEHAFNVPFDYSQSTGKHIGIRAREVRQKSPTAVEKPWLVFLQGGPGFAPAAPMALNGWCKRATEEFRVLLLEQRGTGRSTPVSCGMLQKLPSLDQQVEYLARFRADNIVGDCEFIRQQLSPDQPWGVLGQSFGGFCVLNYLSQAPEGLNLALLTGGLASLHRHPDEVYRETYQMMVKMNEQYFKRFPEDQMRWRKLAEYVENNAIFLPNGDRLSKRLLQCLGIRLGVVNGALLLHHLISKAYPKGTDEHLHVDELFLWHLRSVFSLEESPIYYLLHESIYAQNFATEWSAERVRKEFPEFDREDRFWFTGEMMYPWMADDLAAFKPLKSLAQALAEKADWPALYNLERLRQNTVPSAAAVYFEDTMVPLKFSLETAAVIPGMKTWITSEYEHSGIGTDGYRILDRLLKLARGDIER